MARALRIELAGSFYHVTCRGNERKAIYRDDTDRQAFLTKLQDSLRIYQVELHGYVLMDNHFHLMVRILRGNLSEFMRHFNISYTSAFNWPISRNVPTQLQRRDPPDYREGTHPISGGALRFLS